MLPIPPEASIIYDDPWLYVCLASFPITRGHTIVVWKNQIPDLKLLSDEDYDYLMEVMDVTRDALLKVLEVEKVYLMYMDEAKHVHWHLVPRYNEKGFNIFTHEPQQITDFTLTPLIKEAFLERLKTRDLRIPKSKVIEIKNV